MPKVCELCGQEVRPWLLESHGKEEAVRHFEVLQKKLEKVQNEANQVSKLAKEVAKLHKMLVKEEVIVTILNTKAFVDKFSVPNQNPFATPGTFSINTQATGRFKLAGKEDFFIQAVPGPLKEGAPTFLASLKTPPGISLRVQLRASGACCPAEVSVLVLSHGGWGTSDFLEVRAPSGGGWKTTDSVQISVQLLNVVQLASFG